jgi:hypothetical protein
MTTSTKTRSRKSGDPRADQAAADAAIAAENAKLQPEPDEEPDDLDEDQEPEPEPTGKLDIGTYAYVMHKPTVTGPDGVEHGCPHRWGHEQEKDAMKCARQVARQAGLTIA